MMLPAGAEPAAAARRATGTGPCGGAGRRGTGPSGAAAGICSVMERERGRKEGDGRRKKMRVFWSTDFKTHLKVI